MNLYQWLFLLVLTLVSGYYTVVLTKQFSKVVDEHPNSMDAGIVPFIKMLAVGLAFIFTATLSLIESCSSIWNYLGKLG